MKRILIRILIALVSLHIILCVGFYFFQEKAIFHPTKLEAGYQFKFDGPYKEIDIETEDAIRLNGLLFETDSICKGLIFYLHGNAGALNAWGQLAPIYTELGYDIFFLDYRGYGKSEGEIDTEYQLLRDVQSAYNELLKHYKEESIVVLGYSIGTGPTAYLASVNTPSKLILQAPYYTLSNVIKNICPLIPNFAIKYKLETYKYITDCKAPVFIFHGDNDKVIDYENSIKLSYVLKEGDELITLKGGGHDGFTENKIYRQKLNEILR
ncbi:alpha/beta hydrolase [Dysgonomonas sp. Marseille-P4361]|uniref:alpha/beta hydrolase n=1 Tax=Dysgonomonas sp. Marseille-P4361 TaxID=2161820 RepID=UPI000D55831B|nr:alpha/beta fold hydrolase [Dysgonomonas sp. Marseille-P4361]